ncbi:MAG: alpha/beta hydrolase [Chloroflexota bacterium]|nr:alpha/beta hydrolase [Chloroflexota bacterium]
MPSMRLLRRLPVTATAQPAQTYAEAVARLHAWQATETDEINPLCRTHGLIHGYQTARSAIFLHGFTNCPHQFHALAAEFYGSGFNVLNVRLPYHGHADRLTTALSRLTAQEMIQITGAAIDIAHGLGERVTLLGFSLGGVLAAWAAQTRVDVDQAVLVSPAIGLRALSQRRSRVAAHLLLGLPNFFRWWDPVHKDSRVGPAHAYPRYASRGLGALLRLGGIVRAAAQTTKPLAPAILVITNPCDEVVDNTATAGVVQQWRSHGAVIQDHEFPADWRLIHDLMDPTQPDQQVARVYPQLIEWIVT